MTPRALPQEVAAADATHAQYRHLRALRGGNGGAALTLSALASHWRRWRRPPTALQPPPPAGWGRQAPKPLGAGVERAGLLRVYARLTTRAGDRLARRALRIKAALHRLSPASVWFTRHSSPPSCIHVKWLG